MIEPRPIRICCVEEMRRAWERGQRIDLTGVGYGRIHWDNQTDILDKPVPYYTFLAGWCEEFRARRVLEIGTHWGGSAVSMARGMKRGSHDAAMLKLVTVDITEESNNFLPTCEESSFIHKIVGDANSYSTIERVANQFDGSAVDLVYIDADHTAMPTFLNFVIYAMLLKPKVIILDDIDLSEHMSDFWRLANKCQNLEYCLNIVEYIPEVRGIQPPNPGFGYVRLF